MYRFLPVDRSPTVFSQAAAIAAAPPDKDRDNTFVVYVQDREKKRLKKKAKKLRKMKRSQTKNQQDAAPSDSEKPKSESNSREITTEDLPMPDVRSVEQSTTVDSVPSLMAPSIASSPDVIFCSHVPPPPIPPPACTALPPPPAPPAQILLVQEQTHNLNSQWALLRAPNGMNFYYNPATGERSYWIPPAFPVQRPPPPPSHNMYMQGWMAPPPVPHPPTHSMPLLQHPYQYRTVPPPVLPPSALSQQPYMIPQHQGYSFPCPVPPPPTHPPSQFMTRPSTPSVPPPPSHPPSKFMTRPSTLSVPPPPSHPPSQFMARPSTLSVPPPPSHPPSQFMARPSTPPVPPPHTNSPSQHQYMIPQGRTGTPPIPHSPMAAPLHATPKQSPMVSTWTPSGFTPETALITLDDSMDISPDKDDEQQPPRAAAGGDRDWQTRRNQRVEDYKKKYSCLEDAANKIPGEVDPWSLLVRDVDPIKYKHPLHSKEDPIVTHSQFVRKGCKVEMTVNRMLASARTHKREAVLHTMEASLAGAIVAAIGNVQVAPVQIQRRYQIMEEDQKKERDKKREKKERRERKEKERREKKPWRPSQEFR